MKMAGRKLAERKANENYMNNAALKMLENIAMAAKRKSNYIWSASEYDIPNIVDNKSSYENGGVKEPLSAKNNCKAAKIGKKVRPYKFQSSESINKIPDAKQAVKYKSNFTKVAKKIESNELKGGIWDIESKCFEKTNNYVYTNIESVIAEKNPKYLPTKESMNHFFTGLEDLDNTTDEILNDNDLDSNVLKVNSAVEKISSRTFVSDFGFTTVEADKIISEQNLSLKKEGNTSADRTEHRRMLNSAENLSDVTNKNGKFLIFEFSVKPHKIEHKQTIEKDIKTDRKETNKRISNSADELAVIKNKNGKSCSEDKNNSISSFRKSSLQNISTRSQQTKEQNSFESQKEHKKLAMGKRKTTNDNNMRNDDYILNKKSLKPNELTASCAENDQPSNMGHDKLVYRNTKNKHDDILDDLVCIKILKGKLNYEFTTNFDELLRIRNKFPQFSHFLPGVDAPSKTVNYSVEALKTILGFLFNPCHKFNDVQNARVALDILSTARTWEMVHFRSKFFKYTVQTFFNENNFNELYSLASHLGETDICDAIKDAVGENVSHNPNKVRYKAKNCTISCESYSVPLEFPIPLEESGEDKLDDNFGRDIANEVVFEAISGCFAISGFQLFFNVDEGGENYTSSKIKLYFNIANIDDELSSMGDTKEKLLQEHVIIYFNKNFIVRPGQKCRMTVETEIKPYLCWTSQDEVMFQKSKHGQFDLAIASNYKTKITYKKRFFIQKIFYHEKKDFGADI